ncbi:MAG TPA: hypothetical protein VE953_22455 [Terriglobales bacterium]|nr:hypothetical protein [Terriglobales bacterium]
MALPNGSKWPDAYTLLKDGSTILILAALVLVILRGDLITKSAHEEIVREHEDQMAACERSRDAVEATLRAYVARDQAK